MKLSSFATDQKLELNGVWRNVGQGLRLLVARDNNPEYLKAVRKAMAPYKSKFQRDSLSVEESETMMSRIMADTILLDWENLEDDKNKKIKYTPDAAFEYFETYPEFKTLVTQLSSDVDFYRQSAIKEVKEELKK